ncbi:MAG: FumA C-terminus/TtdB family hydratase beta subunit [Candidatus Hadarchaeota archaeon]|nr:FumA C-terminus/TtdB family hydratase beta subunit [Candidatus Hadarchaeota archaeon]
MSGNTPVTTLKPPLSEREVKKLRAGEFVKLTGKIVTARDRAYARMLKLLRSRKRLPVDLRDGVIYHCGPLVKRTPKGWKVISAGPTTSARLDEIQAEFVRRTGVRALVGKGGISEKVARKIGGLGCVYLAFPGGAGALAAQAIRSVERVLWRDLGPAEALWTLQVRDFGPLTVAVDTHGRSLYHRVKD